MAQSADTERLPAGTATWPATQAAPDYKPRRNWTPIFFAAPAVLFVFFGTIFMSLYALYISFHDYQLQRPGAPRFIGFQNYVEAFTDEKFHQSIITTFLIAIPALILQLLIGLGLALFLNRPFRFRALAISLIVTPVMVSPAAAGMAWRLLLEPRYGPVNDILSRITRQPVQIGWLSDINWARPAIVLTDVWHMAPFVMLLFLAGLSSIPEDIYDAAKVDGSDGWRQLIDITLPLLKPIIVLVILLRGIDLVRIFDLIFIMTKGGPGTSTKTLSYYIYENGLGFFRIGYAAAMAWLVAIVFIVFSKFYLDAMNRGGPEMATAMPPPGVALSPPRRSVRDTLKATGFYLAVILIVAFFLFPTLWIVVTSLKVPVEYFSIPPRWIPQQPTLEHYQKMFVTYNVAAAIKNTIFIALANTLFTLGLSIPLAYAVARYRVGGGFLPGWIISQRMLPAVAIVLPFFLIFRQLQLINTYHGMVIAYALFFIPFATWLLLGFFEDFPRDIQDAAMVDGASEVGALFRIVLPLMAGGIFVVALLVFIFTWNDLLIALVLTRQETRTLMVFFTAALVSPTQEDFGVAAGSIVIGMVPAYLFALFGQRWLVRGLTMGGLKG